MGLGLRLEWGWGGREIGDMRMNGKANMLKDVPVVDLPLLN